MRMVMLGMVAMMGVCSKDEEPPRGVSMAPPIRPSVRSYPGGFREGDLLLAVKMARAPDPADLCVVVGTIEPRLKLHVEVVGRGSISIVATRWPDGRLGVCTSNLTREGDIVKITAEQSSQFPAEVALFYRKAQ